MSFIEHDKNNDKQNIKEDRSAMVNLSATWINNKGAWVATIVFILCIRSYLGAIPGIGDASWTITNVLYNLCSYILFHGVEGIPFDNHQGYQGAYDELTLWEQIDNETYNTPSRKFLFAIHIALFFLSTYYSRNHPFTFAFNVVVLCVVLIAKLPAMHRVRLF
ncbi:uncharacterized protein VTP21DRAFT_5168 [Calcarisporiella thermophila]|uniref:uncharacterized protein n=1 Tax=Calcarisporiella thermophila TaxID=911321 RepID=UPI00374469FA